MRNLKYYTISGIIFVLLAGTLAHFSYNWFGNNIIVGFFTPVNESIWEHTKLLFFPMLLYSFFMIFQLKDDYPCIVSSLCFGILAGTLLIPVLFYAYTGLLGRDSLFLFYPVYLPSSGTRHLCGTSGGNILPDPGMFYRYIAFILLWIIP